MCYYLLSVFNFDHFLASYLKSTVRYHVWKLHLGIMFKSKMKASEVHIHFLISMKLHKLIHNCGSKVTEVSVIIICMKMDFLFLRKLHELIQLTQMSFKDENCQYDYCYLANELRHCYCL